MSRVVACNVFFMLVGRRTIIMQDNNNTNTEKEVPTITTKIGSTTYVVGIHFCKTSKETLKDKIKCR